MERKICTLKLILDTFFPIIFNIEVTFQQIIVHGISARPVIAKPHHAAKLN